MSATNSRQVDGRLATAISQSYLDLSTPIRLDFSRVDTSSTYAALSSCVELLEEAGRQPPDFASNAELDLIIQEFDAEKVDLSDVLGFPYGRADLGVCIMLLARIQNRMAMRGIQYAASTLREIMEDTLLDRSNKNHRYDIGEWIEVRGPSMKYRLERIVDVIRTNDNEFLYETAVDHKLTEAQIRWPSEALRRIYGMSPWVWRQWASLKIENKLLFQEGHPDDFEVLDIRGYALELWELWLADERNKTFRQLFERVGTSGQEELIHHIIAPFRLMHEVVTNDSGMWNLSEANASMFTYMSLLGTGFFDAFIVFLLQLAIPSILFIFYTSPAREDDEIAMGTREMLFAVLVYYIYKVNRDVWTNFVNVAGTSENPVSRIRSLRRITWDEGNDNFLQSLGFSVDLFMNSGYICILYLFNMWILYNVSDPFEILGSVIFFQFVFDLDEEIARSSWWDGNKRLLRAGIISTILQNAIERSMLVDSHTYLTTMGKTLTKHEMDSVRRRFDELGVPRDLDFLHGTESEEGHLQTVEERVDRLRGIESKTMLPDLHEENSKQSNFFAKLRLHRNKLFDRHEDMRAWSQWEILLFAFPTPNFVPPDYVRGSKLVIPPEIADHPSVRDEHTLAPGKSNQERFCRHTIDLLTCRYISQNFRTGSEKETFWFQFTRCLHALAAWSSYSLQLVFPIFSIAALVFVFTDKYCSLRLGECTFAEKRMSFQSDGDFWDP